MSKDALIAGATGQNGTCLTEQLLNRAYIVHAIKRRSLLFNTVTIEDAADGSNAAELLMSTWMISPGVARSQCGHGWADSMLERRLNPRRLRTQETVASESPSTAAICSWVRRWRRKASTALQVAGRVWPNEERVALERSRRTCSSRGERRRRPSPLNVSAAGPHSYGCPFRSPD